MDTKSSKTSQQQETRRSAPHQTLPLLRSDDIVFSTVLPTVVSTLTILGLLRVYRRCLKRIPTVAHIEPGAYRNRSLLGRVTSVGDGDNFHLFHTPGGKLAGWGWLRRVPTSRADLKNKTIPIRLAGVDAPECAHFGRPAQPLANEVLAWLRGYLLHRPVRVVLHKRDQYDRVVATVYVRGSLSILRRRDVGLEMLKKGFATVYEAKSGLEFGGKEEIYHAAEARAKSKGKGVWGRKVQESWESPRDYKTRIRAEGAGGGVDTGVENPDNKGNNNKRWWFW